MRNSERLTGFYNKLKEIHQQHFPDWRFGQFIINFLDECKSDPFYWEEDEFIKEVERYVKRITTEN